MLTVIVIASDVGETSRAFRLLNSSGRSDDASTTLGATHSRPRRARFPRWRVRARARAAPRGRSPGAPSPRLARLVFRGVLVGRRAVGRHSVGGSREWGLGALSGRPPSDAELAAAEERADALKERFALATDPGEQEELLELATEATLLVNTMRAERAFTPAHARAAADEARRALAPERKMLAELLEDASSRREERDARASHALVDVVRARSPVRPAPPRAPVDERVPRARPRPGTRPARDARPPAARGDAPLPPFKRPRGPPREPGNPERPPDDTRRDRRRDPPPRTAAPRARCAPSSPRSARRRRRRAHRRCRPLPPPRIIRASTDHSRETPSKQPADASVAEPSVAEPPSPRRFSPARRSAVSSDGARKAPARARWSTRRRFDRAHAARRGARAGQDHLRAAEARARRSRDGALDRRRTRRERRRGEGEAAPRSTPRGRGGSRRREGGAEAKLSAGGLPREGRERFGVSSAGDPPTRRLPRRRIDRASVLRRGARDASSASGGGGGGGGGGGVSARKRRRARARPTRARARGEGGGRRARGRVRPAVATPKKKRAGVAESESVAAGAPGAAKGSVSSSPGALFPRVALPGGEAHERQAKARSREAERRSGRRGAGLGRGSRRPRRRNGRRRRADRAAPVRDRVRGGFLGAPPRVVRFRRPRVGLVRRARRRFDDAAAPEVWPAARAREAAACGGGGGGGRGEGSRRPR